jgi:hypothetical protein
MARSYRHERLHSFIRGRIVYPQFPIPDPQGQHGKRRPLIVLTSNEDIRAGATRLLAVATSTSISEASEPARCVDLPFGRYAATRFTEASAAVCDWYVDIAAEDVRTSPGLVPPHLLDQIRDKRLALGTSGVFIIPRPADPDAETE